MSSFHLGHSTIRQVGIAVGVAIGLVALAQSGSRDTPVPPSQSWSFKGVTGTFDKAAARRGFQIYAESCANCHSMTYLHYRDLAGIGLTDAQIKDYAASVNVPAGIDSQGNMVTRPGTPASTFRAPFVSADAAREALNGSLPPDLSLIVNTYPDGPDAVQALLTGYGDPPPSVKLGDGMSYNKYFSGHQIAMPPPLNEGQITYKDGTVSTVRQNAHDVVTFLAWAADPGMEERKQTGVYVVLYFLGMAVVFWLLKEKIWANVSK